MSPHVTHVIDSCSNNVFTTERIVSKNIFSDWNKTRDVVYLKKLDGGALIREGQSFSVQSVFSFTLEKCQI